MHNTSELPPELEATIRKHVATRCKFWGVLSAALALLAVVVSLTMLLEARRQLAELTREVMRLRAEAIRFGEPLEIHNPAWGTVIDGADPTRFPSSDPTDGRRGARLHQYVPLSNDAQTWVLRPHPPRQ
jgi:hypothetical protein